MSRPMRPFPSILLVLALGCTEDPSSPVEPTSVDIMLQGLGGASALDELSGFTASIQGDHRVTLEGPTFQEQPVGGTFEMTVSVDLVADTQRVDMDRDLEFFPDQRGVSTEADRQQFTYFFREQGAWVEGRDNNEAAPDVVRRTLPGIMFGAHTKELSSLFPHGLIADAREAGTLTDQGTETIDGEEHLVLRVETELGPRDLLVDPSTGELRRLRFTESEYLRRDIETSYVFSGWSGDGVRFPARVEVEVEGVTMGTFEITDVARNPRFDAELFTPPADAIVEIDSLEELERGHDNSQLHLGFAAAGIGLDKPALDVVVTPIDDGTGNDLGQWHVTGSDTRHHSVIVEQDQGVVLFDAPVRPERGDNIADWIEANIGKPVTHVVISHHHPDHAAGARSLVARGATAVVFEDLEPVFDAVFSAPSTVVPDTLSRAQLAGPAALLTVPRDGLVELPDGTNPIRVYHVPTAHADTMVMPVASHVSGTSLAFTVDIWTPNPVNFSYPEWALPLHERFSMYGIETEQLLFAGGHGGVGTYEEFDQFVASLTE